MCFTAALVAVLVAGLAGAAAFLAGAAAFLTGAFFATAFLAGAFLAGAFFSGTFTLSLSVCNSVYLEVRPNAFAYNATMASVTGDRFMATIFFLELRESPLATMAQDLLREFL